MRRMVMAFSPVDVTFGGWERSTVLRLGPISYCGGSRGLSQKIGGIHFRLPARASELGDMESAPGRPVGSRPGARERLPGPASDSCAHRACSLPVHRADLAGDPIVPGGAHVSHLAEPPPP